MNKKTASEPAQAQAPAAPTRQFISLTPNQMRCVLMCLCSQAHYDDYQSVADYVRPGVCRLSSRFGEEVRHVYVELPRELRVWLAEEQS